MNALGWVCMAVLAGVAIVLLGKVIEQRRTLAAFGTVEQANQANTAEAQRLAGLAAHVESQRAAYGTVEEVHRVQAAEAQRLAGLAAYVESQRAAYGTVEEVHRVQAAEAQRLAEWSSHIERERAETQTKTAAAQQTIAREQARLAQLRSETVSEQARLDALRAEFGPFAELTELKARMRTMRKELGLLELTSELQAFGYYEPLFEFEDSDEFKDAITDTRDDAKVMIQEQTAWAQPAGFMFNGSVAQGTRYLKAKAKLMLRAFNGEADAAIAKVKHSNIATLEKRVNKSFEGVNRAGKQDQLLLTSGYLGLKLRELRLTHERQIKIHEEREEQRRIKQQMREEAKAEKELEKAKNAAIDEEAQRSAALAQAREELEDKRREMEEATRAALEAGAAQTRDLVKAKSATDKQQTKLEGLVSRLETELKSALEKKAKAIARAQLTKSGHVYVISNIGSFGEGVYKIGMTRRLEPLDRVKELGDASVPFLFDVHAMIYSENAPNLEKTLHRAFDDRRVNQVNRRKEFFMVTLEEIRREVARHHGVITFVKVPEAEEYRRTLAIRQHEAEAVAVDN